jgi:hypothetical protein
MIGEHAFAATANPPCATPRIDGGTPRLINCNRGGSSSLVPGRNRSGRPATLPRRASPCRAAARCSAAVPRQGKQSAVPRCCLTPAPAAARRGSLATSAPSCGASAGAPAVRALPHPPGGGRSWTSFAFSPVNLVCAVVLCGRTGCSAAVGLGLRGAVASHFLRWSAEHQRRRDQPPGRRLPLY